MLDSVTARESAAIDAFGIRRRETTAPLTNFFVGRAQQDFRNGDTYARPDPHLGGPPDIEDQHLAVRARARRHRGRRLRALLPRPAPGRCEANAAASHLRGSAAAIDEVQISSARYFQRPDNDYAGYDPTRTSLGGHGGSARIRRIGKNANLSFQTGAAWRSPGFEINDIGFMTRADEINQFGWVGYQIRNPFSIFRRVEMNANEWLDWDFGGTPIRRAANTNCARAFQEQLAAGGRDHPRRRAREQHRAARRALGAGARALELRDLRPLRPSGAASPSGAGCGATPPTTKAGCSARCGSTSRTGRPTPSPWS